MCTIRYVCMFSFISSEGVGLCKKLQFKIHASIWVKTNSSPIIPHIAQNWIMSITLPPTTVNNGL